MIYKMPFLQISVFPFQNCTNLNLFDMKLLFTENIVPFQDEGSFQLRSDARQYLKDMGSENIENLAFRDTWAFITKKGGRL